MLHLSLTKQSNNSYSQHSVVFSQLLNTVSASSVRCSPSYQRPKFRPRGLQQFHGRLTMFVCVLSSAHLGVKLICCRAELLGVVAGSVVVSGGSHQPTHPVVVGGCVPDLDWCYTWLADVRYHVLRLCLSFAPCHHAIGHCCVVMPLQMWIAGGMPMHRRFRHSVGSGRCRRRRHSWRVTVQRVSGLIWCLFEEVVLQCVVRRHAWLGVVLEHAWNNVLEAQVVGNLVARLVQTSTAGASSLHAKYVAQPPCAWRLVLSNTTQHLPIVAICQTNLNQLIYCWLFLHLFHNRNLKQKWHGFFNGQMSLLSPNQQCY